MDRLDRLQQLHRILLSHRHPVKLADLAARLECSERTLNRDIDYLRYQYSAPLEYCQDAKGWHYNLSGDQRFELPGLWLTAAEVQSLALLTQLLQTLSHGLLAPEFAVIDHKLDDLLDRHQLQRSQLNRHIKILPINQRHLHNPIFSAVCQSLLQRQRLDIDYSSFGQQRTRRTLSPQTLIYYRENWYLDAWCHLREELRTFALARIVMAQVSDADAIEVSEQELQTHFAPGYGIFSGVADQLATLRCSPHIAHEISQQQWHHRQTGQWQGDEYLLTFPYSDARELVQDILRHTPNMYVESPLELRALVKERLIEGLMRYGLNDTDQTTG